MTLGGGQLRGKAAASFPPPCNADPASALTSTQAAQGVSWQAGDLMHLSSRTPPVTPQQDLAAMYDDLEEPNVDLDLDAVDGGASSGDERSSGHGQVRV